MTATGLGLPAGRPVVETAGAASEGARAAVMAPTRPMRVLGAAPGRYALLGPAPGIDDTLVCLEAPHGLGLPISVTVSTEVLNDAIDEPAALAVGDGGVRTRGWQVIVRRWLEDRVALRPEAGFGAAAVARLRRGLMQASEPPEPRTVFERAEAFRVALADGTGPQLRRCTESLIGLGLGATPAGDDVVAGAAVALHAVCCAEAGSLPRAVPSHPEHPTGTGCRAGPGPQGHYAARLGVLRSVIDDRAAHTAPLSGALLRAAAEGRGVAALRRFIESGLDDRDLDGVVQQPADRDRRVETQFDGRDLDGVVQQLLGVGHSSGYFLAAGALAAAEATLAEQS